MVGDFPVGLVSLKPLESSVILVGPSTKQALHGKHNRVIVRVYLYIIEVNELLLKVGLALEKLTQLVFWLGLFPTLGNVRLLPEVFHRFCVDEEVSGHRLHLLFDVEQTGETCLGGPSAVGTVW